MNLSFSMKLLIVAEDIYISLLPNRQADAR